MAPFSPAARGLARVTGAGPGRPAPDRPAVARPPPDRPRPAPCRSRPKPIRPRPVSPRFDPPRPDPPRTDPPPPATASPPAFAEAARASAETNRPATTTGNSRAEVRRSPSRRSVIQTESASTTARTAKFTTVSQAWIHVPTVRRGPGHAGARSTAVSAERHTAPTEAGFTQPEFTTAGPGIAGGRSRFGGTARQPVSGRQPMQADSRHVTCVFAPAGA